MSWEPKKNKQLVVNYAVHDRLMKLCLVRGLTIVSLLTEMINNTEEVEFDEIEEIGK